MRKIEPKEIWIQFCDQDQKAKEAEMNVLLNSGEFVYKDAKMFKDERTGERKKFWILARETAVDRRRARARQDRFGQLCRPKGKVEEEVDVDVTGPSISCDSVMDVLGRVEDAFSLPSLHRPKNNV